MESCNAAFKGLQGKKSNRLQDLVIWGGVVEGGTGDEAKGWCIRKVRRCWKEEEKKMKGGYKDGGRRRGDGERTTEEKTTTERCRWCIQ